MAAGVQTVLAMGYTVTVSAAELMMQTLYGRLFAGSDLTGRDPGGAAGAAQPQGPPRLFQPGGGSGRLDAAGGLPEPRRAPGRAGVHARRGQRALRAPGPPLPAAPGELWLRGPRPRCAGDRATCCWRHNVLLVRGMGGAGKTTLLHHLGEWWQATGFVDQVFYFGYDERAWTCQQIHARRRGAAAVEGRISRHVPADGARRAAGHAGRAAARDAPPVDPGQPGIDHRRGPGHPQHAAAGGAGRLAQLPGRLGWGQDVPPVGLAGRRGMADGCRS